MNYQAWIAADETTVQYAAILGSFVILALAEIRVPLSPLPPDRLRRWRTNILLPVLAFTIIGASRLSVYGVSAAAAKAGFGLLNQVAAPAWVALLLTFLGRSLASWILHLFMHKIGPLWRIHRIHHLDTRMDVSTNLRFHPLELLFSALVGMAAVAILGLPIWALLTYDVFETIVRCFSHANIRLPEGLDRALRILISTPRMHRLHHSILGREYNSNYGTILSVWDRFFGTFLSPKDKDLKGMRLGQAGADASKVQSFWWLLGVPFLKIRK